MSAFNNAVILLDEKYVDARTKCYTYIFSTKSFTNMFLLINREAKMY